MGRRSEEQAGLSGSRDDGGTAEEAATKLSLGRDNQIIAATGSAEIVAAATPRQIVDLSRPAPALRAAG